MCLMKIMEHIGDMTSAMQHLTKNNILYNQNGLRSKLSTETHLIEFSKDMWREMKGGKQSDVVVMAFAKLDI